MLFRSDTWLEGTINHVSSKLNIMQVLIDYMQNSFSIEMMQNKARKFAAQGLESVEATAKLPTKAADSLDMLQKGQMKLGVDLAANREFAEGLRAALAILSLALIASALIIASCIFALSDYAPFIAGVSVPGTAGLALGVALGIYIVVKTHKYLK